MSGFETAANAFRTVRTLMDLSGDNIANSQTPGYRARRAEVSSVLGVTKNGLRIGSGAEVTGITRMKNELAERLLLSGVQERDRIAKELEILGHLESLLLEPSENGIDARLGNLFDSIGRLAGDPDNAVLKNQAVNQAVAVAETLNRLAVELDSIRTDAIASLEHSVKQINTLSGEIAQLNSQIMSYESEGAGAHDLADKRDYIISKLAELINFETHTADSGAINISVAGTLIVNDSHSLELEVVSSPDQVYVARKDAESHVARVTGGALGGYLNILNNGLHSMRARIDELANGIRRSFNMIHTTSLPPGKGFTTLQSAHAFLSDTPVAELGFGVPEGDDERLIINVRNLSTGEIRQFVLEGLDTAQGASDFLQELENRLNAEVDNINASTLDGKISIDADEGYSFDFATPYPATPQYEAQGAPPADPASVEILGGYANNEDLTYEARFLDSGVVGEDAIRVEILVKDDGGDTLRAFTRELGENYQPGSAIALEEGLKISFGAGEVIADDGFAFTARGSMDSAGILDALGLNTFFNGLDARSIHVCNRLRDNPSLLAGGVTPLPGDNTRFKEFFELKDKRVMADNTTTINDFYRSIVMEIGASVEIAGMRHQHAVNSVHSLEDKRDAVSGVSIDEEMMTLVRSQRLFQAAARYLTISNSAIDQLINAL